jgi:hypothetical protein
VKATFKLAGSSRELQQVMGRGAAMRRPDNGYVCEMGEVAYGIFKVV